MRLHITDRQGGAHRLDVAPDRVLMEVLRDEGFGVEAVCGGCCSCATCHVHVAADWVSRLPPRGDVETELLAVSEHYDAVHSRLSCQIRCEPALDGLTVRVAPEE